MGMYTKSTVLLALLGLLLFSMRERKVTDQPLSAPTKLQDQ